MSIDVHLDALRDICEEKDRIIENLRATVDALQNGEAIKVRKEPEPLKEFASIADLVEYVAENGWDRAPYTAEAFTLKVAGTGRDTRPYTQYIVHGIGRVYRWSYSTQKPDWYSIAHNRIVDVTGHVGKGGQRYCIAMAQEGDDAWEDDEADMLELVRNYSGGLTRPLSSWDRFELGKKLKAAYLETHDDPGIEYTQRNPSTHAQYGNW